MLAALVCAASGCSQGPKEPASGALRSAAERPATAQGPAVEFKGVTLSSYVGSRRNWVLKARHMAYDAPQAHLDAVQLESYGKGMPATIAQAPEAVMDPHTGDLAMLGPVHVHAVNHDTAFSADRVHWHATSQQLMATGHVRFHRGVSLLEGSRLEADSQLRRVRVTGLVEATVSVPLPSSLGRS